jgi:AcrR family transcriptional regulator
MVSPGDASQPAPIAGLRERKKEKTRLAIQREAMRLFAKQGYEATTIEQIAEAVEISPSTFFNYFPSKEDVIVYDGYDPLIIAAFTERPADEPMSVMVRRVTETIAKVLERDRDMILFRTRLALETPELRSRMWEEMERGHEMLGGLIAGRAGRNPHDLDVRVVARVITAGMWEAFVEGAHLDGRADLPALVNRAMDIVDAGARLDAIEATARRPRT